MATREMVLDFLSQKTLALMGMSRGGRKFGNSVYRELKAKGFTVYPVHPEAEEIGGERCWPNLRSLPAAVGGLVIVVPPAETEKVVEEAHLAGIQRVWMQQGSESPKAIRYCEENDMKAVSGECILMFAEPAAFFHRAHRWMRGVLGRLPR